MKKIALAAMLATGLMGADDFFGLSIGDAELTVKMNSTNADTHDTHYTATLGHYYGETGRISLSYTYVEHEGDVDKNDAWSLAYDFILPLGDDKVSLYAGPVAGYTEYKDTDMDLSDFHYGAQAGVILRLINTFEVEAGYRYLVETGSDTVSHVEIEAKDVKMWYVGGNVRF